MKYYPASFNMCQKMYDKNHIEIYVLRDINENIH